MFRICIIYLSLFGALCIHAQGQICTLPQWTGCQQLIIDTDGGVDDAVAMFKLLFAAKLGYGPQIRAITVTYGITNVNQAAINIGKTLSEAGFPDIPYYIGASEPLVPPTIEPEPIYGTDAYGDIVFNKTIIPPTPGSASHMLVSLVDELGDNAIVMTLGPLTNIAMAYKIDKNFFSKLKRLEIVGGSVRGAGDVLPGREFNIYQDPYSFKVVLENTHYTQASLYPLDLVVDFSIPMEFWEGIAFTDENYQAFMMAIYEFYSTTHPTDVLLAEATAYAAILFPDLMMTMKEPLRVDCVLSNEGRGVLLVDYANKNVNPETSNFNVAIQIDLEAFKRLSLLLV